MKGAVVLISGGAAGIGLAIAERVVARAGRAILWDASETALAAACASLGAAASPRIVDVADPAALAEAEAELDGMPPTHLVNNAGIEGAPMPWTAIDTAAVARVLAVNVTGLMAVTSAFLRRRLSGHGGAIVNLSSIAADTGGAPGHAAYGASKGAVVSLTRALARDLAPELRVNALAPGIIDTAMQRRIVSDPKAAAANGDRVPLRRTGTTDEVARAAEWLLFDAAYTTGEVVRVAGGLR